MEEIIDAIHASPIRTIIHTTGAGATSISTLLARPGASKTLLDATVPYNPTASSRILDSYPSRYFSQEVAAGLAQHAHHRCSTLTTEEDTTALPNPAAAAAAQQVKFVGVGATSAVRTDRTRRGEDGCFVTAWTDDAVTNYRVRFSKDDSRADQEAAIAGVILFALARCEEGVSALMDSKKSSKGELFGIKKLEPLKQQQQQPANSFDDCEEGVVYDGQLPRAPDPFLLLMKRQVETVTFNSHGIPRMAYPPCSGEQIENVNTKAISLVIPGSFAPLHFGITELGRVAGVVLQQRDFAKTGRKRRVVLTYEISANLVGKRFLHESDLMSRVEQFREVGARVAVTRAKLFSDKSRLFPGAAFAVGIDTAERILNPKHYGGSVSAMIEALTEIRRNGCFFVVGGRVKLLQQHGGGGGGSGGTSPVDASLPGAGPLPPPRVVEELVSRWVDASSLTIPAGFEQLFLPLARTDFRVDISSTEIRARSDCKDMKLYVDVERIYNELREVGIGPTDNLRRADLSPFDNYHYFGLETVEDGCARAKIAEGSRVLDVGSGVGGPARFMAERYRARVEAVELQRDVSEVAKDLTERCGLSRLVTHKCADFMAETPSPVFDAVVSWLVFVHIPDRKKLLKKCFDALKPGGRLFVEDFFKLGEFSSDETRMLNHEVHCYYLPTLEEWREQLAAAGFSVSTEEDSRDLLRDFTTPAVKFAVERKESYKANLERHVRVHGEETARGMMSFYETIAALFTGGRFGLVRVLARKPESAEN